MKFSKKMFSLLAAFVLSLSVLQTGTGTMISAVNAQETEQEHPLETVDSVQEETVEESTPLNDWELPDLNEVKEYLAADAVVTTEKLETTAGQEQNPMNQILFNPNTVNVRVIESNVNWNVPGTYQFTYRVDVKGSNLSYKTTAEVNINANPEDSTASPEQTEEGEDDEDGEEQPDQNETADEDSSIEESEEEPTVFASNGKVTRGRYYQYSEYGMSNNVLWGTYQYYVNGNPAYCIEAQKVGTDNGSGNLVTEKNEKLLKTFYYGYRGPGQAQGIDTLGFSAGQKFIVTHCAASNAYKNDGSGYHELNAKGKQMVQQFEKLVASKEAPTSKISLNQTTANATQNANSNVLKTGVIQLNAFADNTVKVALPSGVTMLDPNGKVIGKPGTTVSLKGTTKFVLSKTITASAGSNTLTFNGTFNHDYANHVLKTSSSIQDFGYLSVVTTDPGKATLKVNWPTKSTQITITKNWEDANNQDGKRPESIIVEIYRSDSAAVFKTVTLSAADGWKLTVNNLPAFNDKGEAVSYSVKEKAVPGYTTNINGTTITNSHQPEMISIQGSKIWDDNNNAENQRPDSITVHLFKSVNGSDPVEIASKTVTESENWKYSFSNLPKYEAGSEITYFVSEDPVFDYETIYSGTYNQNITNKYAPDQTSISVIKVWNDANNQDGVRPNVITVQLTKNGKPVEGAVVELSEANGWKASFTGLNKFDKGQLISWNIQEVGVSGYETMISPAADNANEYVITNTHAPEKTRVAGEKIWKDAENQDGKRPEEVEIELLADGVVVDKTVANADSNWKYSFEDLPKFKEGSLIAYTVREKAVEGYQSVINGLDITNSYAPEKTSISVTKVWNDDNNRDGIRPEFITVVLTKNGQKTDQKLTLSDANNWSAQFINLDKYEKGALIQYSVEEVETDGYVSIVTGSAEDGFIVINDHEIELRPVEGLKLWDDESMEGKRPASINVHLYGNGQKIDSKTVTPDENGEWKYSFGNLPVYEAGVEIEYTVMEEHVGDYSAVIDGMNIRNSYTPGKRSVSVMKVWNDVNNQDGIRPLEIEVELYKNGNPTGIKAVLNEANGWTTSFEDLDDYDLGDGAVKVENIYTVKETSEVDGYTTMIEGDMNEGFQIVNSHAPETIDIRVSKNWDDNNNQDGKRPEAIELILLADGQEVNRMQVQPDEAGEWKHTFSNLPKYRDQGVEIEYRVVEKAVDDYVVDYETEVVEDGKNVAVTNAHMLEKVSIPVSKTWLDADNQDGIRPESIEVLLLANGEKTGKTLILNDENDWLGVFGDLDRYENGKEIEYSIEEVAVDGYETAIESAEDGGFTITNTHQPETVSIKGSKFWTDNENQDGMRPDRIQVNLRANGEVVETFTATAENGWKWTFENLPKFKNGKQIVYTITEGSVENYTMEINDHDLTNAHTPGKTSLAVAKVWVDENDKDGLRPNKVVIELLANGKETGKTVTLNDANRWQAVFTDLDIYENQKKIEYSVREIHVDGYSSVVTGNMEEGFTVTNTHNVVKNKKPAHTSTNTGVWIWAGIGAAALIILAIVLVVRKKGSVQ